MFGCAAFKTPQPNVKIKKERGKGRKKETGSEGGAGKGEKQGRERERERISIPMEDGEMLQTSGERIRSQAVSEEPWGPAR